MGAYTDENRRDETVVGRSIGKSNLQATKIVSLVGISESSTKDVQSLQLWLRFAPKQTRSCYPTIEYRQ